MLADPEFMRPKKIDCILGADVYSHVILQDIRKGHTNAPIAQNTLSGWIVTGTACPLNWDCLETSQDISSNLSISFFSTQEDTRISEALMKFWKIEQIPKKNFFTPDELPAERPSPDYPFAVTGLDYAGPIKVTQSKGREIISTKGYICIFVCFVTRAVHIEIDS